VIRWGPAPAALAGDEGQTVRARCPYGRVLWKLDSGLIESSPLLVGKMLYFASYDSVEHSTIWALDVPVINKPRWLYSVPSKVTSSPALLGQHLYIATMRHSVCT